jgi:phage tail protein X
VTNVLDRDDALVALQLNDPARLRAATQAAGKVVLARDGRQPTVGNEVRWGGRDGLSGAILLARSLLAATADDRAPLLTAVKEALAVPIVGGIADGQPSVRNAMAQALPDVPHQRCQVPSLQAAATLV